MGVTLGGIRGRQARQRDGSGKTEDSADGEKISIQHAAMLRFFMFLVLGLVYFLGERSTTNAERGGRVGHVETREKERTISKEDSA